MKRKCYEIYWKLNWWDTLNFSFSILSQSNIEVYICRRKCMGSSRYVKNNWQNSMKLVADDIF